jgi:hypothetical protein
VAGDHPQVVKHALSVLGEWSADALSRSPTGVDPLRTVLRGEGPWHSRVDTDWYLERLRSTGRGWWADQFALPRPPANDIADQSFLNPSTPSERR